MGDTFLGFGARQIVLGGGFQQGGVLDWNDAVFGQSAQRHPTNRKPAIERSLPAAAINSGLASETILAIFMSSAWELKQVHLHGWFMFYQKLFKLFIPRQVRYLSSQDS
jgi:hypothetical protein